MKVQIPLTAKAARMRLSRHLKKIGYILIITRPEMVVQEGIKKFTIIDRDKEKIYSSSQLTPLLAIYNLIKDWEFIEGEEREADV